MEREDHTMIPPRGGDLIRAQQMAPLETLLPGAKPKLQRVKDHKRAEKVKVHLKLRFLKVGEIDTVKELFKARVFIEARWLEPELDHSHRRGRTFELMNPEDYWGPELNLDNLAEEGSESIWYLVTYNNKGRASILQRRTVRATFNENMELKQYPFDSQDLTVTVTSRLGSHEVELHAHHTDSTTMSSKDFSDSSEWFLHKDLTYKVYNPPSSCCRSTGVNTTSLTETSEVPRLHKQPGSKYEDHDRDEDEEKDLRLDPVGGGKRRGEELEVSLKDGDECSFPRATVCMSCRATRKPLFFVLNVNLFIMILGALIFSTFAIKCTMVQSRLQTTATIMLSNIAFKLAVSHTLPQVSYFTYLDFYILLSLVQMGLVCGWHAIVSTLTPSGENEASDTALLADKVALLVLGVFYLLFNVVFLSTNLIRVYRLQNKNKHNKVETTLDKRYKTRQEDSRDTRKVLPTYEHL